MANAPTRERQTLNTIEAALKLIDSKKDKLKEAYDELQLHSSILTCSLTWDDLDSHFSSQQADLNRRFHLLQSREKAPSSSSNKQNGVATNFNQASSSQPAGDDSGGGFEYEPEDAEGLGEDEEEPMVLQPVAARPELTLFCEKLDGKGLRDYISDHAKERVVIRAELTSAMQVSSDPGTMVLDAMEGFYPANSSPSKDQQELYRQRKSCLDLLEVLVNSKPDVSDEVRERAKQLALEWSGEVSLAADNPSEALAFLNVVAAFGLRDQIDVTDLVSYFVAIAKFKQAMSLCRNIGLGENIAVLVQKLIESGKQLLAVKFIYEFGLTDKFQAVSLLKEVVNECKKSTNQVGKSPIKAQHEAKSKELNALKSVLQVIDEHKLESEYPRKEIENRIEILQMQNKTDGKRATPSSDTKPQQQQQQPKKRKQMPVKKQPQGKKPQHNGNNRFRPQIRGTSFHQPHLQQPTGLYQAARPYGGMVSASPPVGGPYRAGSYAAGPYSSAGPGGGFPGNPNRPVAQQYTSESQMVPPPGYYDGAQAAGYHGGYGYPPPQHHQNYYPQ